MLKKLELFGFKSIRKMELELKPINVLIGANGAGKSNLIEIFHLLKSLQNNSLQLYIGKAGGANCLLHYGASVTNEIYACLSINTDKGSIKYHNRLTATVGDTLIFADESLLGLINDKSTPIEQSLGAGLG